jgi:hypothetical protein
MPIFRIRMTGHAQAIGESGKYRHQTAVGGGVPGKRPDRAYRL